MPNVETLLMVFIAVTGLSVLLQACVLLGIYFAVRKAVATGAEQANEFRTRLTPVLDGSKELIGTANDLFTATKGLIDSVQPGLKSAATELAIVVEDLHQQSDRLHASLDEVTQKAQRQADRIDGMTTSLLDGLDRFGSFVSGAAQVPLRQIGGVVAAARAVIETLRSPAPPRARRSPKPNPAADERDLFV